MGEDLEKVRYIIKISQDTISLETTIGDDEDNSTLEDFIEDVKTRLRTGWRLCNCSKIMSKKLS